MNYSFLNDYKGVLIITFVVIAIVFYAKDLEGVLLMTGIIVNIIAICLNTGATNFKGKKLPMEYLSPRRYDLIDKNKERATNRPTYEQLSKEDGREKKSEGRGVNNVQSPYIQPSMPFQSVEVAQKYKGAVDYDDGGCSEMYPETGMDRAVKVSLERQGVNYQRQISGAMRRRKVIWPQVSAELVDWEQAPWWGQYDLH